ncbi:MAG TPA: GTPase ObgE [Candidatus Omnitrophota bacterium]|nr:GTPase ObgE [Candidatus Omnitrophota bacterium]HPN88131.1 GTPase ObgE [Candidatus Omnitrophota bacterium]
MLFVDEVKILVQGGQGGQGCESFYRDRRMRHPRPDGGDGGRGGNVIIMADRSLRTLLDCRYRQNYKAEKGGNASSKGKTGKTGADCIIRVPEGTIVKDEETRLQIRDLVKHGDFVVVAKGGQGGFGNVSRKFRTEPQLGEERALFLELKVVADVGLIGFPNAGKSTLISAISKVKSKIANYPFTTKQPILGIVITQNDDKKQSAFVVADLPGIIEGAHLGKGLGHQFLRHAERTKILVHVLDMGAMEGRDPLEDYKKLNAELKKYSDSFLDKYKIIVANKMDMPEAQNHLKRFHKKYKKQEIFPISALERKGLENLIYKIKNVLEKDNFSNDVKKVSQTY